MTRSRRRRPELPRLYLTPGEPAGVGPDLALVAARRRLPAELVAVADPELLRERARRLRARVAIELLEPGQPARRHRPNRLWVRPVALAAPVQAGVPDPANASYVLETLQLAVAACEAGHRTALVTGPVHKATINQAGIPFSGHTEFIARLTGVATPVMMLAAGSLRVALATTHLPLRAVPDAITAPSLKAVLRVLAADLSRRFGIRRPRILVAGLNPHAGEDGHLGHEERDVIAPVLAELRAEGLSLDGPLAADTLFTRRRLAGADAVLALYHDQGLPVLKYAGFGRAVNVTLGLPIIRTSVDHGTALDAAGRRGAADPGSLLAALALAARLAARG